MCSGCSIEINDLQKRLKLLNNLFDAANFTGSYDYKKLSKIQNEIEEVQMELFLAIASKVRKTSFKCPVCDETYEKRAKRQYAFIKKKDDEIQFYRREVHEKNQSIMALTVEMDRLRDIAVKCRRCSKQI